MMATAALSMAQKDFKERVGALQHYDQATSALQTIQSAEELSSDGAFFTHFLLLIYEVGLFLRLGTKLICTDCRGGSWSP